MARSKNGNQKCLRGKIIISATLRVITGMHIGGSSEFSPIGSVDSPFIRDPLTNAPIIPGSSLKGKMRTLLAKTKCIGYILNKIEDDEVVLARLFGSAVKNNVQPARLQFFDIFTTEGSKKLFTSLDTDTYMGEVKFENTISRTTGVANPRQIERVPAGMEFAFKLAYNIENEKDVQEDMQCLADAFQLLQNDYLGGHGSRGYGRIAFKNFELHKIGDTDCEKYKKLFEESVRL